MYTNNFFCLSRIAMVMKREIMGNRKKNLFGFLGLYSAFLLTYLGIMAKYDGYEIARITERTSSDFTQGHFQTFIVITVVAFLYFASRIMENMRTKELRIAYLMVPATSIEKFVACACYVTVGTVILLIGASVLAELTHFLFVPLFDFPDAVNTFVLPQVWEMSCNVFNPFVTYPVQVWDGESSRIIEQTMFYNWLCVFSILLWFHSSYILGGNIWYKTAFVKTTGIIIAVSLVLAYVVVNAGSLHWNWLYDMMQHNSSWLTENFMSGAGALFFFLLTALNWRLGYKLFTRSQVINPKFRLL